MANPGNIGPRLTTAAPVIYTGLKATLTKIGKYAAGALTATAIYKRSNTRGPPSGFTSA